MLQAIWSLYNRTRSLVNITSSKSDLFPVHAGLWQGCPLSPVLFITFVDRISRVGQGPEGVWFGSHWISSLLFTDDFVLVDPLDQDLQHAHRWFATECKAAMMRLSTPKCEALVLNRKKVACFFWIRGVLKPQVEVFKYLGFLFIMNKGRMECEIYRWIGASTAVLRSLYRTFVLKKELS